MPALHLVRPVVVGAALLLGLTACQTPSDDESPVPPAGAEQTEPAPETSPSDTPEQTPSPQESDPADGSQDDVTENGPNSITSPASGATVDGPEVTVTGTGTAFEATLSYQVLDADGSPVGEESWTQAGANGEVGPWQIDLTLEPGVHTVQVWEAGVADDDEEMINLVEVTFTVR